MHGGHYERQQQLRFVFLFHLLSSPLTPCIGGCGNVCPRGTKCGGGQCVCAKDQCGNLCLDFQTHPRNCGACGTVCPSGICHNGACYTPDPSEPVDPNVCVKKDAIVNGGFGT